MRYGTRNRSRTSTLLSTQRLRIKTSSDNELSWRPWKVLPSPSADGEGAGGEDYGSDKATAFGDFFTTSQDSGPRTKDSDR